MISSIKRVLVATDLTEMDDKLLSFVRQISERVKIEKIYLTHIIPNMLVPANAELAFHKMFSSGYPIDEKVRDVLLGKSSQYFEGTDIDVAFEVVEGKAYQKLLEMIELKNIDLLVVGNKEQSEGSGITARRIARKAKCNILFIPENIPEKINEILVPIDFSKNSARALKNALSLSNGNTLVTAVNIIQMLHTDYYTGLAMNIDFRESMREKAIDAFDDFQLEYVSNKDRDRLKTEVVINETDNVTTQLKDYLRRHKFDLIVMGAKGHTLFELFLMGSVTESFVDSYAKTPVLVIR